MSRSSIASAATWGVADAARRFMGAGGDLALICRSGEAQAAALAMLERDIEQGALDPAPAQRRRRAVRALVDAAGPRPDLSVIGCAEHRALAEEVAQRSAERG